VVLHRATGAPIGAMYLAGIDTVNGKAEFSAGFQRGRGTRAIWEAIHFGLRHAFETLALRKLVFHCLADNLPALAILERAGAHPEGLFRAELSLSLGGYADLRRYALFGDSDWPRLKAVLDRITPLLATQS
jgi:RimJ/RimL family protein N-acetyltransferase